MAQRPVRERAELALMATYAWREAPVRLFSPALRALVGRVVSGIDDVEAAFSGLRPTNPAFVGMQPQDRARSALVGLRQSLMDTRNAAGSHIVIRRVEAAFAATQTYVEHVVRVLGDSEDTSR
jgi:hypothetical protein